MTKTETKTNTNVLIFKIDKNDAFHVYQSYEPYMSNKKVNDLWDLAQRLDKRANKLSLLGYTHEIYKVEARRQANKAISRAKAMEKIYKFKHNIKARIRIAFKTLLGK